MIVYKCPESIKDFVGSAQDCFSDDYTDVSKRNNITDAFGLCMSQFLAGWAVGGESVTYPPDLGMPLYENEGDTFLMLEMHYNNADLLKNKVDNSGMRFWLTENLRKTETTMATFGVPVSFEQLIPPGANEFTNYGYCSASCTSSFPEKGIQLVGGLMHTHLAGRKIRLLHYRNGKQLPTILSDEHYDFNYQDYKRIQEAITILPGDELVAECVYETLHRDNSTFGGYPTRMEMCFIFVEYYPAVYKGFQCLSYVQKDELIKNLTTGVIPDTKAYWTQEKLKKFQDTERNGKHEIMCIRPPLDGSSWNFSAMSQDGYPKVTDPLKPPPDVCESATTQVTTTPVTKEPTQVTITPATKGTRLITVSLALIILNVALAFF